MRKPGTVEAREGPSELTVGVISDTHGLLRPEALRALAGVDHILHAGDVGSLAILEELAKLAPVTAVRGNMDGGVWASSLQGTEALELGGAFFFLLHDLETLDLSPEAAGIRVVVHGHTHLPEIREEGDVLYLNPGSAGPVRGSKPVTVARVQLGDGEVRARVVPLLR
jgi:putative phosphoesterase